MDWLDPNNWHPIDHEFRIYGDDNAQTWAVVDQDDYDWAIRYRWNWARKRNGLYMRRGVSLYNAGQRAGTKTVYLHIEVMKATGIEPPSPDHLLVDHRDGDTTNCRRRNLRWATYEMNGKNKLGKFSSELWDDKTPQGFEALRGIQLT